MRPEDRGGRDAVPMMNPASAIAMTTAARVTFLAAASFLCATAAFVVVGVAHLLADSKPQQVLGQALGPHPFLSTYLIVGGIATGLTALLTWRSRPDLARSANGYLQEWVEAGREAVIVGVGLALVVYFWHPNSLGHPFSRGTILLTVPLLAAALGAVRGGVRFVAARFA
ncbi:MAG: hypothetical protein ACLPTB_05060 [Acidimicrobiales bacterium]